MSRTYICKQSRELCHSPWACTTSCKAGMTMVRRESPRDRAAEAFCNPTLQIDMAPDAADLAIAWVQRWAKHVFFGCVAIAALVFIGAKL